ncbi:mucin-associated surface protein [Trypanosoma cruzi cruzi]|uniref:Mucin-associated surface protein (MASP) n=1 Tax=Trypanosoma cruzi TaxID=5693 RepID=A0A2V2UTL9_TRYCR|nr:mucin-associated surface protein [Trypanosoma cruzi cruzi]PWU87469.1 Mucin-associated surface protein (MASP) [Trypanosoma cruzi]
MAMMMTGRVLLVCALCVLWCGGAALAVLATDDFIIDENTEQKMVLLWYTIYKKECEEKNKENGSLNDSAIKSCIRTSMKEVCGVFYNDTSGETPDPESDRICREYAGDPDGAFQPSAPQAKPLPTAEKPAVAPTPETSKDEAEEMGLTQGPPAGAAGGLPAKPTEGPPPPSAAIDDASNEMGNGTGGRVPAGAPEFDVAGTEKGKESEANDDSTKKTPVETVVKKGVTAPEDTDSSTAVSHTTYPLLLLVVACAAAVVAA